MSVTSEMLLHPELLSNAQLIAVLRERHLRVPNLEYMLRHELLELFHQYCVPYGQRRYKDNTRGKLLNKNRNIEATTESLKKLNVFNNETNHDRKDRLKPPPDISPGHVKKIKLNVEVERKPITVNMENSQNKRKLIFTCLPSNGDMPPAKKERKLISWP